MSPVVGSNSPLRRVLWLLGYNSSEAVNIRSATRLYDAVCAQADTDGLHDTVEMIPVFYSRWCVPVGIMVSQIVFQNGCLLSVKAQRIKAISVSLQVYSHVACMAVDTQAAGRGGAFKGLATGVV